MLRSFRISFHFARPSAFFFLSVLRFLIYLCGLKNTALVHSDTIASASRVCRARAGAAH